LLEPLPLGRREDGRRFGFVTGCRRCGLVFVNPMPSRVELDAFYSPDGEWGRSREASVLRDKAPATAYVAELFRPISDWMDLARPPTGRTVFEFGCGDGELLDVFQDLGWDTCGLDPGDKRAFARHRELPTIPETPTFDVTIIHHVLEHVDAPLDILHAIHRALKPDGFVLVSVPRLDTLPRHKDFRYCINPRTHIVAYSRDCMATLFALAGFDSIDLSPPADSPGDDWFTLRRLRMIGRKREPPPPPPNPLAAARKALARFHAEQPSTDGWRAALPVRLRAGLAHVERAPSRF
jgi:SAM-dependent methyltransferase